MSQACFRGLALPDTAKNVTTSYKYLELKLFVFEDCSLSQTPQYFVVFVTSYQYLELTCSCLKITPFPNPRNILYDNDICYGYL